MLKPKHFTLLFISVLGLTSLLPLPTKAAEPQQILLWPDGAPGALGDTDTDSHLKTPSCPPGPSAVKIG